MKQLLSSMLTGAALIKKGKFTMKFTKKSIIVKSWVAMVAGGLYSFDDVPKLFNLRTVVSQVLAEQEVENKE